MLRVPIVWGLVDAPDKALETRYGGVIYGGCCVPDEAAPRWGWLCPVCGFEEYAGKSEQDENISQ